MLSAKKNDVKTSLNKALTADHRFSSMTRTIELYAYILTMPEIMQKLKRFLVGKRRSKGMKTRKESVEQDMTVLGTTRRVLWAG